MQPKSFFNVVPKFSNTGTHTQLDESCQHIIALFLYDSFTIPSVKKVVSCFHYLDQINVLVSHFSLGGTCPPISNFLTLLF